MREPVKQPFSGSKNSKANLASPCYQRYLPAHLIFLLTTKKQMIHKNHLLGTERSAIYALMYNMCQRRTELNSHPTSTQNDAKRIRTSGPRRVSPLAGECIKPALPPHQIVRVALIQTYHCFIPHIPADSLLLSSGVGIGYYGSQSK